RVMPLASEQAKNLLFSMVEDRGLFGIVGLVGLVWASTRLFGSLRTVLEVVFEIPPEHRLGIVEGKIHDVKLVVVVGTLFLATISLTTGLQWMKNYGVGILGLDAYNISWITSTVSTMVAFAITLAMFFFVYRYAPDRTIPRSDALIAAMFSGVLFEFAKQAFVAYLAEFGRFLELYGSFTNLVAVAFWVYYSSVVFILGGELARIVQYQRGKGPPPGWEFAPRGEASP
ncbi:MAG: YihY/virulence factor BrkB family protein, partial [Gemmatimonadota bacterium]|nr:YihY/virulence factor BrkB family protein [Gemmatimonadota bacterium]